MFVPKAILIEPGTEIRGSDPSNLPHDLVGVFQPNHRVTNGTESADIIPDNSTNANANTNKTNLKTAEVITIYSGFIEPSTSR
jgi:hypothetical protein